MQTNYISANIGFRNGAFFFIIPILVYLILMCFFAWKILQATGHVVYPIDDPYIHLAIARHLAQDGFFGVSLFGYSATSSARLDIDPGISFAILGNLGGCPAV